ncbi:MAG TPA: hypothetical protein VNJ54_00220 [Plantibacter sp.]|uniref:hypothetical protein n=1 Tax=unclassified Plantibacter TaxID=2624265 RepID=UPI002C45F431|nr:hypothetical protein [Plantibacter sp.]
MTGPQQGPGPGPASLPHAASQLPKLPEPGWVRALDRLLWVQRPVVVAHIRSIRRAHPNATADQLIKVLERRYLTTVTTTGAAVGATAVVPAIGTATTLALSGVETAGFLEATALFAQSVTEVHGIALADPVRSRALVMTMMLGKAGTDLLRNLGSQAVGQGVPRQAFWGEMIAQGVPSMLMGPVADQLRVRFVKHFAASGGAGLVGKALPFGIGAAVGGIGNHVLGRQVVKAARQAFGPPPFVVPLDLEPRMRAATDRPSLANMRDKMLRRKPRTIVIENPVDPQIPRA